MCVDVGLAEDVTDAARVPVGDIAAVADTVLVLVGDADPTFERERVLLAVHDILPVALELPEDDGNGVVLPVVLELPDDDDVGVAEPVDDPLFVWLAVDDEELVVLDEHDILPVPLDVDDALLEGDGDAVGDPLDDIDADDDDVHVRDGEWCVGVREGVFVADFVTAGVIDAEVAAANCVTLAANIR